MVKPQSLGSDNHGSNKSTPPPDGGSSPSYSPGFEAWFAYYRNLTGRGTGKKASWSAYRRLAKDEQRTLVALTQSCHERREAARRAGIFLPEWKDPERFLRGRWEAYRRAVAADEIPVGFEAYLATVPS